LLDITYGFILDRIPYVEEDLVYSNLGDKTSDFGVAFENGDQSLALPYTIKARSQTPIRAASLYPHSADFLSNYRFF